MKYYLFYILEFSLGLFLRINRMVNLMSELQLSS